MRSARQIILTIISVVLFALSGLAQTTAPAKIAIIDSNAFYDDKTGIKRIGVALAAINTQFEPLRKEIEAMRVTHGSLLVQIENLKKTNGSPATIKQKSDEAAKLEVDLKRKAEDAQKLFDKTRNEKMAPVADAISKHLQEYGKAKGYSLLIDLAKDVNGMVLMIGDPSGIDVTTDFIAFSNAKP